ncbi:MAG: L,D-transpeptidase/peptidoglycan binding protein [Lachnospiraceae bacterium]|nr:L,D-transpeptidase/peptidoglycan binding protein [Lachnospiraceae bacterium]
MSNWREIEKQVKNKRRKKARYFLRIPLILLLALYVGPAIYFAGHFSFNTYVNGNEAFKKTAEMLEEEMLSNLGKYKLTVHARGVDEVITAQQLSITPRMKDQYKDILKSQNPLIWPVYLFKETHLTTANVVEYSDSELEKIIDKMSIFDVNRIALPVDAHVSEESGDDGFYVVKETDGNEPIRSAVVREIGAALDVLESEVTLSDECYTKAEITSDDPTLNKLCDNLNTYCKVDLVYQFGEEEIRVNGTRVREWCDINGTEVTLDEEKIKDFVTLLSRTYDTFGKTRHLKTHSGEVVDVTGGDYGWWMDRATETKELTEDIKAGKKGVRTPVYFGTAAAYGEEDWGDSYVEINLDKQHLWVYSGGTVVEESDFVSGCVNKRTTTPVGTYAITYKEREATLNGENYSSSVDYWMPFNGNVGMHDASWRSKFGGELYVTNGSHGCINLPKSKAAAIYDIVTKGEAVLVYGGKVLPDKEEEPIPPEIQALIDAGLVDPATLDLQQLTGGAQGGQSQEAGGSSEGGNAGTGGDNNTGGNTEGNTEDNQDAPEEGD